MAKHWSYFLFLLWICYLIISGVLIFTRGFLLRRNSFNDTSTCISHNKIPCTPADSTSVKITNGHEYECSVEHKLSSILKNINSASEICFPKKSKVILLVIDALRYDFTVYNPTLKNPFPFENKLPVIHELLKDENHAKLFKFIADPPTTTVQRLKALTTGSLPTFIDAGSNFATPEINEDNLIDQLRQSDQNVVFMGDDTWMNLYPNRFLRSWPFPSFNVWDLDTVDYGILNHLYTEIGKDDWSLLIAHFLGVDHCGHRYGPYHQEMERKLKEMNNVIKKVVNTIDEDTMLFVIGDHGMTATGDHGGETEMEVTSALFVYSAKSLASFGMDLKTDAVKQIDLIPTLAAILGVPIPFSNLGSIIFDAVPTSNKTMFSDWQTALWALWANVQQITNYINRYSDTSDQFSSNKVDALNKQFAQLRAKANSVDSLVHFRSFAREAQQYLVYVRETCEEVWVQFDSFSMSRGLLIVFLTIFFGYIIVDGISGDKLTEIFSSSFIRCSYTAMAAAATFSIIAYSLSFVETFELTLFFSTGIISFFMLAVLVIQNWELIAIHWYEGTKARKWFDIICRVILLLFVCTLFSNSYVLEDAAVLSQLLLGLILFTIYNSYHNVTKEPSRTRSHAMKFHWKSPKLKLVLLGLLAAVLIRISMHYWRCREEQKWCISYVISNDDTVKTRTRADKVQCITTLVFLALLVSLTRIWLRSCGNLCGFSALVTYARYAPTVIVVCTGGFWALHRLPKETKSKLIGPWQGHILAWVVYGLLAIGVIIIVLHPLTVYVLPRKKNSLSVRSYENLIPQIFNHVKDLYAEKRMENGEQNDKVPIVYGLGTVYSTLYIIASVLVCLLIALLLGDALAPSSVIMYFTGAVVLTIISIVQRGKANSIAEITDVPSSSVLCWVLLSHYFFYGTGHQPTFPAIQWEAAFVGTSTVIHNGISATLIGINTFGSYIVFGITLPLLVIAPFTLYMMMPNWGARHLSTVDVRRGEMILSEHDELLMRGIFSLSCKYILFHGIRVFACMLAATVHCRHLMVWAIFAPKLIFEGLAIMVTLPCVLVSYLLLIRVHTAVDNLVASLAKQSR